MNAVQNLVQRDRDIAGLATILDPERLANAVQAQMGEALIEDLRLDYIRYKPGMNCIARLVVRIADRSVSAYAKAHGPDAKCKMQKATIRTVSETEFGPGRILLDDEKIVFSIFPNDAKIRAMQSLADERRRVKLLSHVFGKDCRLHDVEFDQSLNYKPERRYVVRLKRSGADFALLKFHTRQGYHRALCNQPVANVIGHSERRGVIAYRWVAGETLRNISRSGKMEHCHINATARALAEFHSGATDTMALQDRTAQIDAIESLGAQISFLLPHLQARVVRAARRLAVWLQDHKPVHSPVHGDFYDKQVVIRDEGAVLIDMDEARVDDPLADLGNFIAHVERQVVSGTLSACECQQQTEDLVSCYRLHKGVVSEPRLRHFVALGLFHLLHQPFRDFEESWPEKIQEILMRVEELIGGEEII